MGSNVAWSVPCVGIFFNLVFFHGQLNPGDARQFLSMRLNLGDALRLFLDRGGGVILFGRFFAWRSKSGSSLLMP